jgi:hypothetical protein
MKEFWKEHKVELSIVALIAVVGLVTLFGT